MKIYLVIVSIVKIFNRWNTKIFISKSCHFFFWFRIIYLSDFFSLGNNLEIIRIMPISSCWVIMSGFRMFILLFFWLRLFSTFFLFNFNLLSLEEFFESHCWSSKSLWSFLQILLVLKVNITNKLLFRYFHNFIFVHTSCVECLWTSHTLEYWHCVPTDAANVTVM